MCSSGRAKIRILFVYYQLSSFVRNDLEILKRHFDVKELRIPTFRNPLNILKLLLWVAHVDLVYTWFAGTNAFFAVLFSKLLRKKSIVVVGGYEGAYVPEINYGSLLSPLERVKVKYVLRHASMVLPVSKSTAIEMLRITKPKKFEVVYNGVDLDKFKPLGKKEDLVITVASVISDSKVKLKGLDTFVKASVYLPHTPFIVIGKCDNLTQEHLKRIGGSNVKFVGYCVGEALLNYYRKAKVYCQLSAHESFGVALAEAMACGCVPVVTRRYALPEVVGDVGFYVPYNAPEATAEAIKKALKSSDKISGRERIQQHFSLKAREEKLIKEVNSLIEMFHCPSNVLPTKIDVVMITKNSLNPCLKECIDSIFQNIKLNKLIVIDSNSSDGTIDLLKKYDNKKIFIIQKNCKRGEAMETGIKAVETEWFAFVDSDVILSENWFQKIKKYIGPKIGAVEGNVKTPSGVVQRIRPTLRAYTNCTLIKTSLVKDIKIPREMNVYEDQFIRRWMEKKGFKWFKVSDPCSIHISISNRIKDAFEVGRMAGKYKLSPFSQHLMSFIVIFVKKLLGKTNEPIEIYWNNLKGYIKGVLERGRMKYERSRDV